MDIILNLPNNCYECKEDNCKSRIVSRIRVKGTPINCPIKKLKETKDGSNNN